MLLGRQVVHPQNKAVLRLDIDVLALVAEEVGVVPGTHPIGQYTTPRREQRESHSALEENRSPEILSSHSLEHLALGGSLWNGFDFFMM